MVSGISRSQPSSQSQNTAPQREQRSRNIISRFKETANSMRQGNASSSLQQIKTEFKFKNAETEETLKNLSKIVSAGSKPNQKDIQKKLQAIDILKVWINDADTHEIEKARLGCSVNLINNHNCTYSSGKLKIHGSYYMTEQHHYELPDNLHITENFVITNARCTRLPDYLKVEQYLMADESNIDTIGEGLEVGLDLNLRGSKVAIFPADAQVQRNLVLSFSPLKKLPDQLKINGNLDVSRTEIEKLPTKLEVGGDLNARSSSITAIPELKEVKGNINFANCAQLTDYPDFIAKIGRRPKDFKIRIVTLTDTSIPKSRLEQLPISAGSGAHFIIHSNIHIWRQFPSIDAAITSWGNAQNPLSHIRPAKWGLDSVKTNELNSFLAKLHSTQEATTNLTRIKLIQRVQSFIENFDKSIRGSQNKDPKASSKDNVFDFHEDAMSRIENAHGSCHDGVSLVLLEMDTDLKLSEAFHSSAPEQKLKDLSVPFMAMDAIRTAAMKLYNQHHDDINMNRNLDDVEVILYFLLKLKNQFELPFDSQQMSYDSFILSSFKKLHINIDNVMATTQSQVKTLIEDTKAVETFRNNWTPLEKFYRYKAIKKMEWKKLPKSKTAFAADDCCVYTSEELRKLSNPIEVNGQLYELEAFARQWIKTGEDPFTRQAVSATAFHQVAKPKRK